MSESNNSKKGMGSFWIAVSVLVVVCVVALGGYAYYQAEEQRKDDEAAEQKRKEEEEKKKAMESGSEGKTLVENAAMMPELSSVVGALTSAKLDSALGGNGPFTVFAPSNSAFAKLQPEMVSDLLKPENVNRLTGILTYHVVPGQFLAGSLVDGQELITVNGQKLSIKKTGDSVMINDAKVTTADVKSKNGVIHLIDTVLMPKDGVVVGGALLVKDKTMLENLQSASTASTLMTALRAASLDAALGGTGPLTVLAPSNSAFSKLAPDVVQNLLKPENKAQLTSVLTYHVIPGSITSADLKDGAKIKTLQGGELEVKVNGNRITIGGATVEAADVVSSNGVIHVIDTVLIPS